MTMKGSKLALLLLLVVVFEILLFSGSDANPWWRRRRRRYVPPCSSSRPSFPRWVNSWQKNFNVRCHNSYSIKEWQSLYRDCKGDRLYHFKCKYGPFSYRRNIHCSSTHYVNYYDRPLAFKCPRNGVLAGIASIFSVTAMDRRFSFRCCRKRRYIAHSCMHTVIQNRWHQKLRYVVPRGYYLVGAFSEHQNGKKDRIWKFEICKFSRVLRRRYG
ncbi:hemagglutinin/amebocyte aggregation factor-like [Acropora palmata]|uniref:hemagglutinin/amebocyte aggregation factor-like n=1 Tax=Acropora palmata TaxID=6131 RepID=UPI003DA1371D